MEFRLETHFHTKEVSWCAHMPAAEAVRAYHEAGYSGIVVTDHYCPDYFEPEPGHPFADENARWQEQMDWYVSGYKAAAAAGKPLGMTILLGMELRFNGSNNDYLIYGITEELLRRYPRLYRLTPEAFYPFAKEHGLMVIQAHPFRSNVTRCNPDLLEGVEVYNGNHNWNSNNDQSLAWATQHGKIMTSGTDFHELADLARGGMVFDQSVADMSELMALLRKGGYTRIETK